MLTHVQCNIKNHKADCNAQTVFMHYQIFTGLQSPRPAGHQGIPYRQQDVFLCSGMISTLNQQQCLVVLSHHAQTFTKTCTHSFTPLSHPPVGFKEPAEQKLLGREECVLFRLTNYLSVLNRLFEQPFDFKSKKQHIYDLLCLREQVITTYSIDCVFISIHCLISYCSPLKSHSNSMSKLTRSQTHTPAALECFAEEHFCWC